MASDKKRLLWIDTDVIFIEKICYAFDDAYIVIHALDLKQAFTYFKDGFSFDLILMNILPDTETEEGNEKKRNTISKEVFDQIQSLKQDNRIPLIVVSALSRFNIFGRALEYKADDYFYKGDIDINRWKTRINWILIKEQQKKEQDYVGFNDELRKDTFVYTKINLPDGIKIAIKQYLMYFTEYVRLAKQQTIHFELRDCAGGVEIETLNNLGEEKVSQINTYFKEYFGFLRRKFESISFEGTPNEVEKKMLRLKLEQQVDSLEKQLELLSEQNSFLEGLVNNLVKTQIQLISPFNQDSLSGKTSSDRVEELKESAKYFIIEGAIEKGINLLLNNLEKKSKKHRELSTQLARLNRVKQDFRIDLISNREKSNVLSQITFGLLEIINELENNDFKN